MKKLSTIELGALLTAIGTQMIQHNLIFSAVFDGHSTSDLADDIEASLNEEDAERALEIAQTGEADLLMHLGAVPQVNPTTPSAADKAVKHVLTRIARDPRIAYYFCPATEAYELLTAAHVEKNGGDLKKFRDEFSRQLTYENPAEARNGEN